MPPGLVVAWQAKFDDATEQLAVGVPRADDADLGIGRAGDCDDIRVALPGVGGGEAVLIRKRRFEGNLVSIPFPTPTLRACEPHRPRRPHR